MKKRGEAFYVDRLRQKAEEIDEVKNQVKLKIKALQAERDRVSKLGFANSAEELANEIRECYRKIDRLGHVLVDIFVSIQWLEQSSVPSEIQIAIDFNRKDFAAKEARKRIQHMETILKIDPENIA